MGGALEICRTLLDRQCGRAGEIVSISLELSTPYPRRAPTPQTLLRHPIPGSASYRREHQKTASGDLCDHNLLFEFEAGEQMLAAAGNLCDHNLL